VKGKTILSKTIQKQTVAVKTTPKGWNDYSQNDFLFCFLKN